MINPDAAFRAFGELHAKASAARAAQGTATATDPALAAGRALGLTEPLTLEGLVASPHLGALSASPTQTALLRAADGRPVNDILAPDRMVFHFGCERLPENDNGLIATGERLPSGRPRYVVLRTGVRAGKTLISVLALLLSVLTCKFRRPPKPELGELPGPDGLVGVRKGELVRALIVAPRLENTRAAFAQLIATMNASPHLKALFAKEPLAESCIIRRPDGHLVEIKRIAADVGGANLRSTWLAGALFDEADFHDGDEAAVNLTENLRACRARLLEGAQIWIPSSPWAEDSAFDRLFREAFKAPLANATLAFHSDTVSMNPTIDRDEMARERASDPDNAAREYDAIPFGAGSELFYPEDALRASFVRTEEHNRSADGNRVEVLPPAPGMAHTAGGDMGFRKNSSALAISRIDNGRVRLAFRLELRPQKGASLKPSEVTREFAFWCMRYGAPAIVGDLHYADSTREELGKLERALRDPEKADAEQREWVERVRADRFAKDAKVPVYIEQPTDQKTTADIHTEMRRRMQEGLCELPADDRMRSQARETKRRAMPGGHIAVLLPKQGMSHGDLWGATVIACALPQLNTPPPRRRVRGEGLRGYGEEAASGNDRGYGD